MERSDDRLSTRDIASPTSTEDARFERDAGADPATTDAAAIPAERRDRDFDDPAAGDRVVGDGDIVTDEPIAERDTGRDTIADPGAGRDRVAERATDREAVAGPSTTASGPGDDAGPLLPDSDGFQSRWEEIQVRFVDEPRGAVEDADALVATVMQRLAEGFAQERERLEAQWGRGEDISTEDLRVALQRYRSFFQRLLST